MVVRWDLHYVDYSTAALPDRKIAIASFCDVDEAFSKIYYIRSFLSYIFIRWVIFRDKK